MEFILALNITTPQNYISWIQICWVKKISKARKEIAYFYLFATCPDVRDSEAIEQVDQGDGEGEDKADEQEQLGDEREGVGGIGVDVAIVDLPYEHCHHFKKHSSSREVWRGSKNYAKGNSKGCQKRHVEDEVLDKGDLDLDEHEVGGGDGGMDAKGVGKEVEAGDRKEKNWDVATNLAIGGTGAGGKEKATK